MARSRRSGFYRNPTLVGRVLDIHWSMVLTTCAIATIGFFVLYSVSQGNFAGLAGTQLTRFAVGLGVMLMIGLVHIRVWWHLAYPLYFVVVLLLLGVEFFGESHGGAKRWIDLGFMQLQPSEIMKIALILVLARYFHAKTAVEAGKYRHLILPVLLLAAPAALVVRQPDLGTTLLIAMGGAGMLFLAGIRARIFVIAAVVTMIAVPIGVNYFLHDYQRNRILTFLDPESDPLGAGYHIQQSKIALGSGGVSGKGFMQGTQTHLDFLPEKQTDFIFTTLAEEFGFIGGMVLLGLYALLLIFSLRIGMSARNHFGRLLAIGMGLTLFLYVFINIAMVMGLIPVVGVPLPLVSYGGSAMMTVLVALGLMLSVHVYRDVTISRQGHAR